MKRSYEEIAIDCAFENLLETVRITAITSQTKARFENQLHEDIARAEFLRCQILKDIAEHRAVHQSHL